MIRKIEKLCVQKYLLIGQKLFEMEMACGKKNANANFPCWREWKKEEDSL